jgi:hypothetical protein
MDILRVRVAMSNGLGKGDIAVIKVPDSHKCSFETVPNNDIL